MKTYTQDEIDKALFQLNKRPEKRIEDRKDLNKDILSIKKNIEYYENIDKRQFKFF